MHEPCSSLPLGVTQEQKDKRIAEAVHDPWPLPDCRRESMAKPRPLDSRAQLPAKHG